MGETTMAEDDIYKSKARYENFVKNLEKNLLEKPKGKRAIYYCKNPKNLEYFRILIDSFDVRDLSFIRRIRVLHVMKIITYVIEKDLKECERADINKLVAYAHKRNKTVESKKDFIKDLKNIWKHILPEKDEKGRFDETIMPYVVRHLKRNVDKSKEKRRNDRLTLEEFQKIVKFFANEPQMQAYLTLATESLGRPQEILYTRIKDYEFYDNYARVWISEHGKEGTGFLQCIDSYPFVVEWFKNHPFKDNKDAFFFITESNQNQFDQLKNKNINQKIQFACKTLGIQKNITCYSLKRNGVTFRRQRGDSDLQIQQAARWTSTKQLQVYDMNSQEDAFKIELRKRGLMESDDETKPEVKNCQFCSHVNGFTSDFCTNCKRPLNREKIQEAVEAHERMMENDVAKRFDKIEQMFEGLIKQRIH